MDEAQTAAFIAEERTVTCATVGPRGWPHLMPLWYVLREVPAGEQSPPTPRIWAWTYGSSQKVLNLERDPRATLQVEAAEEYHELRGVMLECEVVVHRELELVSELGAEILLRNSVPRESEPPAKLPKRYAKSSPRRLSSAWAWSSSSVDARRGITASSAGCTDGGAFGCGLAAASAPAPGLFAR